MSNLDFKSEEEKVRILAEQKEKTPKTIHTVVSIIYAVVIVLNSPLLLLAAIVGSDDLARFLPEFFIPVVWTIGSIIVSRVFINKNRANTAYTILFSVPLVVWLFLVRNTW
jgi:hypothetical protein